MALPAFSIVRRLPVSTVLAQIDTNSGLGHRFTRLSALLTSSASAHGYLPSRMRAFGFRMTVSETGHAHMGAVVCLRSYQQALSAIALSATAADFDFVGPHRLRACEH